MDGKNNLDFADFADSAEICLMYGKIKLHFADFSCSADLADSAEFAEFADFVDSADSAEICLMDGKVKRGQHGGIAGSWYKQFSIFVLHIVQYTYCM